MGGDHVGGVGPDIGNRPGEGGGDGEDHGDSGGEDYDHFGDGGYIEDCGHGGQSDSGQGEYEMVKLGIMVLVR